jgi:hypothetical protein
MEKSKKKEYQKFPVSRSYGIFYLVWISFFEIVSPFILLEYLIKKLKNT